MPDFSFQGIKNALMYLLGQSQGEDAVAMLVADHRRVKELFDSFKDQDDDEKIQTVHKTLVELALHAACEEKLVYPVMREEGESEKEEVDESVEEHHLMKVLMRELDAMSGINDTLKAKYKVLGEIVQHHVEEEEHDMFPKLRSADDIDLYELGQKIAAKKEELLTKLSDSDDLGMIDPELRAQRNDTGNAGYGANSKVVSINSKHRNGNGKPGAKSPASASNPKTTNTKEATKKAAAKKTTAKSSTKPAAAKALKKPATKKVAASKKTVAAKATKPAAKKAMPKPTDKKALPKAKTASSVSAKKKTVAKKKR